MKNTMKMNRILNTKELTMVVGGTTGPLSNEERPLGWPNGWDFSTTGPLETCDPPFKTGPLETCDPPFKTGPLGYPYEIAGVRV